MEPAAPNKGRNKSDREKPQQWRRGGKNVGKWKIGRERNIDMVRVGETEKQTESQEINEQGGPRLREKRERGREKRCAESGNHLGKLESDASPSWDLKSHSLPIPHGLRMSSSS